jgi:hypothetical protein
MVICEQASMALAAAASMVGLRYQVQLAATVGQTDRQ